MARVSPYSVYYIIASIQRIARFHMVFCYVITSEYVFQ